MKPKHNFRSIKDATFDAILPPNADPERAGLIAAGNPHVIAEAHGLEPYARKRKRGGRVKHAISGAHVRHRLDRRSRRKFASGGDANALPYGGKGYVPVMGPPPVSTSNIVNWWRIPRDPPPQQDPMQPIREAASMGLFKKKESDGDGDTTPSPPTGGVPLAGLDPVASFGLTGYGDFPGVPLAGLDPTGYQSGGAARRKRKRGGPKPAYRRGGSARR